MNHTLCNSQIGQLAYFTQATYQLLKRHGDMFRGAFAEAEDSRFDQAELLQSLHSAVELALRDTAFLPPVLTLLGEPLLAIPLDGEFGLASFIRQKPVNDLT